jgi:hypothetical protein
MGWDNEEVFKTELEKGAKKASKARIDHLTTLAVQDVNLVRKHAGTVRSKWLQACCKPAAAQAASYRPVVVPSVCPCSLSFT